LVVQHSCGPCGMPVFCESRRGREKDKLLLAQRLVQQGQRKKLVLR
jgi:hypothetical protein